MEEIVTASLLRLDDLNISQRSHENGGEIAAAAGKKDRSIIFRMVATGISRRLGWPDMRAEDMSL
jgi:hypothetical protein